MISARPSLRIIFITKSVFNLKHLKRPTDTLCTWHLGRAVGTMEPWQEQTLAIASLAVSLLILLSFIAVGWMILWHTTLKEIGFFREIMGLNRPKPEVKAQRQATMQAEIDKIKKQHSRGHRAATVRSSRSNQLQQQQQGSWHQHLQGTRT